MNTETKIKAYVDGSFIENSIGYGSVILCENKVLKEISGFIDNDEIKKARQIGGEISAVKETLNWCKDNNISEISIYYDYEGIEKWARGLWKTNQNLTKEYKEFVNNSKINIKWNKVESHTGDFWNDKADELAKKGAKSLDSKDIKPNFLITELNEISLKFIYFLKRKSCLANLDKIYNNQYMRLLILNENKRIGIFDLYNTKNKKLSPYLHNFTDSSIKDNINSFWLEFKKNL